MRHACVENRVRRDVQYTRTLSMPRYLFIIGLCLLPALVHGAVYQWVDKHGRVHFGNVPPQQQHEYKRGGVEYSIAPESVADNLSKSGQAQEKQASISEETRIKTDSVDTEREKTGGTGDLSAPSVGKQTNKQPTSKFYEGRELKNLIGQLREKIRSSAVVNSSPSVMQSSMLPEKSPEKFPGPAHDSDSSAQKEELITEVHTNAVLGENGSNTDDADTPGEKDVEKCGVFRDYVTSYKLKIVDQCPGAHCDIYQRNLEKYRVKQKQYCE